MNDIDRRPKPDARVVAIVGVGLLGGSVARTLRRLDPSIHCRGYARSAEAAERLRTFDWLDQVSEDLSVVCHGADVVVVASPVDSIASLAVRVASFTGPDTLITDVGSTKVSIVEQTEHLANFVAAHPIAGSEQSGPAAAMGDLFEQKTTIVTPGRSTSPSMLARCHAFWNSLGSATLEMSPQRHDQQLAAVSHVPHLIAALVARSTPAAAAELVGSGWRDITRVAAGDVAMWTAIVDENRDAIAAQLRRLCDDLDELIRSIDDTEAVKTFLQSAKTIKDNIHP